MSTEMLLDIMKTNNDVYTAAYKTGYAQGYKDAIDKAMSIIKSSATEPPADLGFQRQAG